MADGFGRVPVEAEMPSGDGQIGRHREFLARSRGQQGAVVADAEAKAASPAKAAAACACCTPANFAEQGNFASPASGSGISRFHPHLIRV
jgi:hypothetical protein